MAAYASPNRGGIGLNIERAARYIRGYTKGESGRAGNMGVRCCIVRRLVEASKSWIFPERTNHIPLRFICSQCPGVFNNVFCWTSWQRGTVSRMHRTLWRLLFASRQTEIFQVVFIHHGTVSSYERVSK